MADLPREAILETVKTLLGAIRVDAGYHFNVGLVTRKPVPVQDLRDEDLPALMIVEGDDRADHGTFSDAHTGSQRKQRVLAFAVGVIMKAVADEAAGSTTRNRLITDLIKALLRDVNIGLETSAVYIEVDEIDVTTYAEFSTEYMVFQLNGSAHYSFRPRDL